MRPFSEVLKASDCLNTLMISAVGKIYRDMFCTSNCLTTLKVVAWMKYSF